MVDLPECNSITSELDRKKNELIHQKVDTTCSKAMPAFRHLGRKIGPFKVGHPYTLENYIARILVEEQILKYTDVGHLNRKAIQKINFQESTIPELRPIKEDFIYLQAHEQLEILNKMYERGKIPRQEFTQFYSDVNDLIRVRISKINRLAIQQKTPQASKLLTTEEKILYDRLSKTIEEWRNQLGKIQSSFRKK